jgi:hypothetical protein
MVAVVDLRLSSTTAIDENENDLPYDVNIGKFTNKSGQKFFIGLLLSESMYRRSNIRM